MDHVAQRVHNTVNEFRFLIKGKQARVCICAIGSNAATHSIKCISTSAQRRRVRMPVRFGRCATADALKRRTDRRCERGRA